MLNSNFFYKLYNNIFMNNITALVSDLLKIKISKGSKQKYFLIVDVGAHKGFFSYEIYKKLNSLNNNFFFYLIEPNNSNADYYKKNFNFKYKYFNYALDKIKAKNKIFYLNNFFSASGSSLKGYSFKDKKYVISRVIINFLLNPFKKPKKIFRKIHVKTITLDQFCHENKIRNISVLKIDTEGTELDVLLGSKHMINHIDIICVELQAFKNYIDDRIKKINKILDKRFDLVYQKRIFIASFLTDTISYDFIYLKKGKK